MDDGIREGCLYPILGVGAIVLLAYIFSPDHRPTGPDCYKAVEEVYNAGGYIDGKSEWIDENCEPDDPEPSRL